MRQACWVTLVWLLTTVVAHTQPLPGSGGWSAPGAGPGIAPPPPPPPSSQPASPSLPGSVLVPGPPPPQPPLFPLMEEPPRVGMVNVMDPQAWRTVQPPGWFANLEVALVGPDIPAHLKAPVTSGGVTRTVGLPFADLEWTGSPRLEIGYRLPDQMGDLSAAYRSVVSTGTGTISRFDTSGDAFLQTRLDWNTIDLLYTTPPLPLLLLWEVQLDAGIRIGAVYFDSRATGVIVQQRVSNHFVGAGLHGGIDVYRHLNSLPGVALYGRFVTDAIFGGVHQAYEDIRMIGGKQVGGATDLRSGATVPTISVSAGVSYLPPQQPNWFRFTFGYQYERWFGVGNNATNDADVSFHGLFLRGEFNF